MIIVDKKEYITPEMSFDRALNRILYGDRKTKKNKSYEAILTNPKQQEILKKYYSACKQLGNSPKTILTKLKILKYFLIFVKKDVNKIKREDIEKFLDFYAEKQCCKLVDGRKEQIKLSTLNLFKITIKYFFKWYYRCEEGYPKIVKWITQSKTKSKEKEILTRDEVKKLMNSAVITRDRCLISILYDAGLRLGEAVNIKLKEVLEDSYGFRIKVDGKTGERRIRLVNSVPILKKWINEHPEKENKDAYLFICLSKQFGMPIRQHGAYKIVEKVAKRAKIKKKIYPHLFRHTRLTHLAEEGFNEMDLRIFAGWSRSSDMPSVYLHNNEKNVEEKILRKAGLLDKNIDMKIEENKNKLKPKECPMCNETNDISSKFCNKCGQILDVKAILDIEKAKDSVVSVIDEDMKERVIQEITNKVYSEMKRRIENEAR